MAPRGPRLNALDGQRIEARGHLLDGTSQGGTWSGSFMIDERPLKGTKLRGNAPLSYEAPLSPGSPVVVKGMIRVSRVALLGVQVELADYELTPLEGGRAPAQGASPQPDR